MKIFALIFAVLVLVSSTTAAKNPVCDLEHAKDGDDLIRCHALIPSWSYLAAENRCTLFHYGGCRGNGNRFGSLEECEDTCKQ